MRQGSVEPQARRGLEVAYEEIPQRLERPDRERSDVRQRRRASGADRATGRGLPRIRRLSQRVAAHGALAELGSESRSIQEVEVEPAADRRSIDARIERAKRGLEEVKEGR